MESNKLVWQRTKDEMIFTSFRMPLRDMQVIHRAARIQNETRSEFLRQAGVERARRIIRKAGAETQG